MTDWTAVPPRSMLFVPADRASDLLVKASRSGADAVILDLEDAVDASRKAAARDEVATVLASPRPGLPVFVRVNAAGTTWHEADMEMAHRVGVDGVVVPKCADPRETAAAAEALGGGTPVVALVESPLGVITAAGIAAAHRAIVGLAFGPVDFAAALAGGTSAPTMQIDHARLHVVLAAGSAGVWAVDGPSIELDRPDVVRQAAREARAAGCSGKLLIHPSQVAPVHEAFRPSDDEVAVATRLLDAFRRASERGEGVAAVDGRMVDAAVAAVARRTIASAERYEIDQRPAED